MRSPDGITESLVRLEKVVAAQNKLVLDLRREVAVVSAVLARATRPSPLDTAARLADMRVSRDG